MLSPDTQAILLLCANFGQNCQTDPQPLTLGEYNTLATWLREEEMTPEDLLNSTLLHRLPQLTIGQLNPHRLTALLQRGGLLALKVEEWTNQGLWIISRSDSDYPQRLKQKLQFSAPPILYGIGNKELLSKRGLAVVGSRHVDQEDLDYTYRVVETCAEQNIQVISGGAKGVDQASMLGALKAGGTVVGVLADSLLKASVSSKYRSSIKEGKLTLISAVNPNANFHVGNAMGRNKYIYALADYGLVIRADFKKGGTWAGATEALTKIKDIPVLVKMQGIISEGNQYLLNKGAKPFPDPPWNRPLSELIQTAILEPQPVKLAQNDPTLPLFNLETPVSQIKSPISNNVPSKYQTIVTQKYSDLSPSHEILEDVDLINEDLKQPSQSPEAFVYTVDFLKQEYKKLNQAKAHFDLKANSWATLANKLNERSVGTNKKTHSSQVSVTKISQSEIENMYSEIKNMYNKIENMYSEIKNLHSEISKLYTLFKQIQLNNSQNRKN